MSAWGTIVQSKGHCGISKYFFPLLVTYLWSKEDENDPVTTHNPFYYPLSLKHYNFEATSTYRAVLPCLLKDLCVASSSLKGDWKQCYCSLNSNQTPFQQASKSGLPSLYIPGGPHCLPHHFCATYLPLTSSFILHTSTLPFMSTTTHLQIPYTLKPFPCSQHLLTQFFFFLKIVWPLCELLPAGNVSAK